MYTVGSVIRFIVRYPHMVGGAAPHILARAYNYGPGGAIMSGNVLDVLGGNMNAVSLFRGMTEDMNEIVTGLAELTGQIVTDIMLVLAIFFEGDLPSTLVTILEAETIDSDEFNTTLRAELEQRGIELEEHVKFCIMKATTPPSGEQDTAGE